MLKNLYLIYISGAINFMSGMNISTEWLLWKVCLVKVFLSQKNISALFLVENFFRPLVFSNEKLLPPFYFFQKQPYSYLLIILQWTHKNIGPLFSRQKSLRPLIIFEKKSLPLCRWSQPCLWSHKIWPVPNQVAL